MSETSPPADVPRFVVVGRTNEGKSSVVSTLVAKDQVEISHRPGTTKVCAEFDVTIDGVTAFTLIDSPGFENARRTLEWLTSQEAELHERPDILRRFIKAHKDDPEFVHECELLGPVLEGAGILYVVDGSHRFRKNYESEIEILAWTSSDRMALINDKKQGEFVDQWKTALGQRFNLVRYFNAHRSGFRNRLELLRALEILCEKWREPIEAAVRLLQDHRDRQHADAAKIIAGQLEAMLTLSSEVAIPKDDNPKDHQDKLVQRFHDELRDTEDRARKKIERLHEHHMLEIKRGDMERPIFDQDLFAEDVWNVLGLTPKQLILVGAATGAAIGGGIDAAVGGASFLAGTLIGGLVGAGSVFYMIRDRFEAKLFVDQITTSGETRSVRVGPHRNPQFPWVVLDRSLLHYGSICNRAHSNRDILDLSEGEKGGLVSGFSKERRAAIQKCFDEIRKKPNAVSDKTREALRREIKATLTEFDAAGADALTESGQTA